MFVDDTQLYNRNEESVEQAFKVLNKYEKASGSKINYEKTKGYLSGGEKINVRDKNVMGHRQY